MLLLTLSTCTVQITKKALWLADADMRDVQDPDFRTRVRQDSARFEQTGSDPDYGFTQVSGSGFSNFIFF